jgi:uncharacterized protein YukE
MKQYFLNLWYSFTGGDPRQWEINRMNKELDSLSAQLKEHEKMYDLVKGSVDRTEKKYQAVVENLRNRVKELESSLRTQAKEYQDEIVRLKKHYQERIDKYNEKIAELTQGGQEEQ